MIGKSKSLFLNTWIMYGVHILQIGLLMIITRNANNFFPSFWRPGTAGIDAFRFTWQCTNNWLVPPPRLIPQVISNLEHEKCKGTLIVPEWILAPFWPMVVNKDGHFRKFIITHKCFQGDNLVKRGRGQNGIFGSQQQNFRLVALRIQF